MNVCCVFYLESPHRGNSNEYTQQTIIYIKKKISLNNPKYNNVCSYGILFLRTQERVRNSRGKLAISVRATEVLLYFVYHLGTIRTNRHYIMPYVRPFKDNYSLQYRTHPQSYCRFKMFVRTTGRIAAALCFPSLCDGNVHVYI